MQNQKSALGLDGNITALIGYPIGIVALILVFIEKDNKFVRFHAFQSLLFWAAVFVIYIVLGIFTGILFAVSTTLGGLFTMLFGLIGLAVFVGMIFLALKAYQGQMFKLPVIGDMAEKWSN
jgi:uncharacterized membrane protein